MSDKKSAYDVLSPLQHDGDRYGPDIEDMASVDLTEKQAGPLLRLGVIGTPEDDAAEEKDLTPDTADERVAAILAALVKGVVKTIPEKADGFNKTGVAALIKELGWLPETEEDLNAALVQLRAKATS